MTALTTAPDEDAVLEAKNLSRSVTLPGGQRLDLLRGIDLTVRRSESVAILGRSGSGKSTLLAVLGLLTRSFKGNLSIAGRDVTRLPDRRRTRVRSEQIGFVFQSYSLVRHLTAAANVELPLMYGTRLPRRLRKATVSQALASVGLSERAHSRPRQLSGGEQQRVAIARALVRRPCLVLADEPTGALDAATAGSVLDVLTSATKQWGAALVLVTHDDAVAAAADRVVVLDEGLLADATKNASHPLAQSL